MPESPGTEKQDKEKEHRDSKKGESAMSNTLRQHTHLVKCPKSFEIRMSSISLLQLCLPSVLWPTD